jgi:hypothetical protein
VGNGSDEVRGIFDAKIDDLYDLLDEQVRRLQSSHPQEKIVRHILIFSTYDIH